MNSEILLTAFSIVVAGAILFMIYNSMSNFIQSTTSKSIVTTLQKSFELIEYGINNNNVVVYFRPFAVVNVSQIYAIVDLKRAIVREIGNGDGIVDPNKGELIEVVFNKTDKDSYNILISGVAITPSSFRIDIER